MKLQQLWQALAAGECVSMQRKKRGYHGTVVNKDAVFDVLFGEDEFSSEQTEELSEKEISQSFTQEFNFENAEIESYNYEADPRFQLGLHDQLSSAIRSVLNLGQYQQRSLVHVHEILLVRKLLKLPEISTGEAWQEYHNLRSDTLVQLDAPLELKDALEELQQLSPNSDDFDAYSEGGDLEFLNPSRHLLFKSIAILQTAVDCSSPLLRVLENREYEINETVSIAIWAIGRQNDKNSIAELMYFLGEFEKPETANPQLANSIELALQFLCSADQLICRGLDHKESANGFWKRHTEQVLDDPEAWDDRDARSIFWEKRLRCARGLAWNPNLMAELTRDEVLPVRLAAQHVQSRQGPASFGRIVQQPLESAIEEQNVELRGSLEEFWRNFKSVVQGRIARTRQEPKKQQDIEFVSQLAAMLTMFLAHEVRGQKVSIFLWNVLKELIEASGHRLDQDAAFKKRFEELASGEEDQIEAMSSLIEEHCSPSPEIKSSHDLKST